MKIAIIPSRVKETKITMFINDCKKGNPRFGLVDKPQKIIKANLLKQWNYDPKNPTDVERLLIETTDTEVHNLEIIKTQLTLIQKG